MKNIYKIFFCTFIVWTLVGVLSKVPFLLMYSSQIGDAGIGDYLSVIWHGLRLDIAIAGYLTLLPGLLLMVSLWYRGKVLRYLWHGYFAVTTLLYSLAIVSNLGLYGYWGFPLDNTPLLYVKTSPADALASMTTWQLIMAPLAIILLAAVIFYAFYRMSRSLFHTRRPSTCFSLFTFHFSLLILTALLILPIRGGVGTGTNHTGSVYFSSNIKLNHAAVNPVFSFIESALHKEEIGTKYRFMKDEEAMALFKGLIATGNDSCVVIGKANVVLICLESFSDTVMHVPGVTPNLNRLAAEGLHFKNFYANSFRTDRALVSIHSALPAQPTMSVMDMPRKSTSLPSIAGTLAKHGYSTTFYYGGDINYSNMKSYFMGTGFQRVVSDVDFPKKQHTGKWGVADGPVYNRMLADIKADKSGKPFFCSVMTESSHEPFDVPNYNRIKSSSVLNAFAYADECLGRFIAELKKLPCWSNTVVMIVPDHIGAYPEMIDNYALWRYKIPFIVTGGAIDNTIIEKSTDVVGAQTDIAATLLGMLGMDHSEFTYSKNLFDPAAPHFAFFTFPDAMGLVEDNAYVVYDNTLAKIHSASGIGTNKLVEKAQAYLQKLYDDIENIDKR